MMPFLLANKQSSAIMSLSLVASPGKNLTIPLYFSMMDKKFVSFRTEVGLGASSGLTSLEIVLPLRSKMYLT
jgi:hypothetical protein